MAYWQNVFTEWMKWFYDYGRAVLLPIFVWLFNIVGRRIQSWTNIELRALTPANTRKFKVYIYQDELEYIRRLVMQKDDIETGGDLFGLWIDKHNVVVQFVLGPGKNCRRSTTSFYQDVDYLGSVGNYITRNHGLCNIGQWHSHHRLDLPKPSIGDENTVWSNMPGLGMERYVVFIATIKDSRIGIFEPTVNVNCFLFEIENESKLPVLDGEICELKQQCSPVRMSSELIDLVESGQEHEAMTTITM